MMEPEIWKDIEEFKGYYQISNYGNIRSLDRIVNNGYSKRLIKGKVLTLYVNINGYYDAVGSIEQRHFHLRPHTEVAKAFLGYIKSEDTCVNHIDENKLNNHISNLSIVSYKDNSNHGTCIKRSKDKIVKPVNQLDMDGNIIKVWDSVRATKLGGFCPTSVSSVCLGKEHYNTHKGFNWEFAISTDAHIAGTQRLIVKTDESGETFWVGYPDLIKLGYDKYQIYKSIVNNREYKGCKWGFVFDHHKTHIKTTQDFITK